MKRISEESVKLIREHLSELDLTFPLDDEDGGYRTFQFFTSMDDRIGGLRMNGVEVDPKLIEDVGRGVMEFNNPDEPIDYEDLQRRLEEK